MYGDYTQQQQQTNNRGEFSLSSTPVPQQLQNQADTDSLANSIVSGAISPIPGSQTTTTSTTTGGNCGGSSSNRGDMQRVISTNQICLDGNGNANMQQLQVQQQSGTSDDQQQHQQQSSSSFSINNNSNSMSNNYNTPNTAATAAAYSNSAGLGTSTIPRPMQKVIYEVLRILTDIMLVH